jgi:magnesium chelatase subunit D
MKNEVLEIAKVIGSLEEFDVLCIDTEDKFIRTGIAEEIARVARGTYHHLAKHTNTESLTHTVRNAIR